MIPVLSSLFKALGAIGIDRGGNDIAAMRKAIEHIKNGDIVAMFPQGHRYPGVNPATTPLKNGAGMISYRAKASVVPVCIKTEGERYKLFKEVRVIYGKPISFEELGFSGGGNDEYLAATQLIFDQIVTLGGYDQPEPTAQAEENR